MRLDGYPNIILGKKKLGGKSHFTKDRFLSMVVRAFMRHSRVVLQANVGTEDLAIQLIYTLKFLGIELEDRFCETRIIDNEEKEIIIFILDKIPILREIK